MDFPLPAFHRIPSRVSMRVLENLFRPRMRSAASSKRPPHFTCYVSCFPNRFGIEICNVSNAQGHQNQASLWRISSLLWFGRFCVRMPSSLRLGGLLISFFVPFQLYWEPWGHFSGPKATTPKFPPPFLRVSASKCAPDPQSAKRVPPDTPKVPKRSPQCSPNVTKMSPRGLLRRCLRGRSLQSLLA